MVIYQLLSKQMVLTSQYQLQTCRVNNKKRSRKTNELQFRAQFDDVLCNCFEVIKINDGDVCVRVDVWMCVSNHLLLDLSQTL
jgi:hypothetical protein